MQSVWSVEALEPKLLLSADLMPGVHEIGGSIDQPGERDVYEFVLDEKTRLMFDGVTGTQVEWSLEGPTPALSFSSRNLTATRDPFLELEAGNYKLTVDGINNQTQSYKFRLLGEESAVPLTLNTQTSGQLNPATQNALYRFSLSQNDRIYFQTANAKAQGRWTLFGVSGEVLVSNASLSYDRQAITASETGEYWLSVEGLSTNDLTDYAFTLFHQTESIQPISLNQK